MNAYFDLFIYAEANRVPVQAPGDNRSAAEAYKQGAPAQALGQAARKQAARAEALAREYRRAVAAEAGKPAAAQQERSTARNTDRAAHNHSLHRLHHRRQSHSAMIHMSRRCHIHLRGPHHNAYRRNGLNTHLAQDCL